RAPWLARRERGSAAGSASWKQDRGDGASPPSRFAPRGGGIAELESLQQLRGASPRLTTGEAEETAEHLKVLAAGQGLVDGGELAGQTDQTTNLRGVSYDIEPEHLRPPSVRDQQCC